MRSVAASVILVSVIAFSAMPLRAATNGLDARFGTGGIVLLGPTQGSGISIDRISALAVRNDGTILIAGRTVGTSDPGAGRDLAAIGRLDANGNWDQGFADNGLFVLPYGATSAPYGGSIDNIGFFSDSRIIASGGTRQFSSYYFSCTLLIKLTMGGSLDTSFAPDHSGNYCFDFAPPPSGYWFGHFDGMQVDSDDTFFLTSPSTNLTRGAVAHLDSNGILVSSYATNGVAALPEGLYGNLLQLASDHTLIVAGVGINVSGQSLGASSLSTTGAVDATFGTNGIYAADAQSGEVGPAYSARDAQGRILVSSNDFTGDGNLPYRLARITATGAADLTFNGGSQQPGSPGVAVPVVSGNFQYDYLVAAQPLPDGHILAVGDAGYAAVSDGSTFNIALLRFNDDASFDAAFGDAVHPGWSSINIGGSANSSGVVGAFTTDSANRAYVAISTSDANGKNCWGLLRLIPDRLVDHGFDDIPVMPTCPQ